MHKFSIDSITQKTSLFCNTFIVDFVNRTWAMILKAKKTHGFNSHTVISVYPLDIPSI